MWILKAISIISILSPNLLLVQGADCDPGQPRSEGDPSGTEIANFLSDAVNRPTSIICGGEFPPGNNNIATFSANLMTFNVTREDASKPIENCQDAFADIIQQCVQNGNFWGGSWSLNGFTYSIRNHVFPNNGIEGPADPTPTITAPPSMSTVLTERDSAGNLVIVTFVPSTIPEFATVTTTTTITTTSTGSDGVPIAVPLIIGIGGLIWVPLGGGPLPPGVTPPPTPPGPDGDTPDQPSQNPDVTTTTTTSPSSTSSSSPLPTVTLIGDPPLPDFQQIIIIAPVGPLPVDPPAATPSDPPAATPSDPPAATPSEPPQGPTIDPHVGTVECFPTHGNTDADKIVSLALPDILIDSFCLGTDPNWQRVGSFGLGNGDPASNNHYDATFTLDPNAPELCKQLYTEQGKTNSDVQNFCKSPFKALTKGCPFNGGRVKADCGEWTLQSCPLGGRCKVGEPGQHCQTDPGNTRCL